jgi:chromate transporter
MHAFQQPVCDEPAARPKSLSDLFFSFTLLALQGFGGVLAVVQRELVERKKWMTQETFTEEWAVAQIMPGPNVINLAMMIGGRYFGLAGALTALAGMLIIPLILVLLLAVLYARYATYPDIVDALRGMSAVSAGLIAATALKMLRSLKSSPLPLPVAGVFCIAGFVAVALFQLPLIAVLLGLGGPACVLSYYRLMAAAISKRRHSNPFP